MELSEKIIAAFPEIAPTDSFKSLGIYLSDDGDGVIYISAWDYSKPIPDGLKIGK
jgi:hypothetical protein